MHTRMMYAVTLFGLSLALSSAACKGAQAEAPSSVPTTETPGASTPGKQADSATEPTFTAQVVSPLTNEVELQIVSVFAYEPNETLISPATELAALIVKPRTEAGFGKEPLLSLLLAPPPAPAKAKKLLYISLGTRNEFSLDRVKATGKTAMRETVKLGAVHMAFAPIVRDQGVTKFDADVVAAAFVEAALTEYTAERRATPTPAIALRDVVYESGPAFIGPVTAAVERGVAAAHANAAH